jgi:hypothetical protein
MPTEPPPSVLAVFEVSPAGDPDLYLERLCELIESAEKISASADFEREEIDVQGLPRWFTSYPSEDAGIMEAGRQHYFRQRPGQDDWDVQEWISCFDGRLRRWTWWGGLREGLRVTAWVNTHSEPVVPMEELWWALFSAGATGVSGPTMVPTSEWAARARITS